jgi:excisionase family DNA binding protein
MKVPHCPAFPALAILMNNPTATPWLTGREAASYLRIETRTLLMWARQGKVEGYSLSGTRRHVWRFLHSDLDSMLTAPSVALKSKRRIQ